MGGSPRNLEIKKSLGWFISPQGIAAQRRAPRTMPPKRAASEETQAETHEAVNKRYRQAIDDVAEEYVCPICLLYTSPSPRDSR